ncbi:hypothetical protein HKBW3S09_01070 [Candidatus Hakubella thermalkaliphila]|uniref:Uncharacterized protein n=1 Tax=Candidatus Hakubella thermalkaliphila TaxID=2754717 RepID=A0A6V8NTH2_9ACTN|nr:hypothetical protein HKBW3S09_01070 [Candidatus Hakubella thermalkaliphila]GFP39957.1 hypothetical protein HKBW3S47_01654 [Candidatus Hakubella thermalkaliphila]
MWGGVHRNIVVAANRDSKNSLAKSGFTRNCFEPNQFRLLFSAPLVVCPDTTTSKIQVAPEQIFAKA